jgi:nicotinamide mononucleotide transporter
VHWLITFKAQLSTQKMQIIHALQQWWAQQTWQELLGVATGLLCVYLAAANKILNWPIAIISTALYVYIYAKAYLYADMLQYVYLCITSIYGWYAWSRRPKTEDTTPIIRITKKQVIICAAIIIITTPVFGYTLISFAAKLSYNPPAYPYIDSFLTACCFVAQILLARKILENWLLWIFADIIYTVIYFKKGLQITSFMFAVLIVIAIFGYRDWKKEYRKQSL